MFSFDDIESSRGARVAAETLSMIEQLMRRSCLVFSLVIMVVLACGETRPASASTAANDRAIVAVVLQDFANWKDVTFGRLEGVLELNPMSDAEDHASGEAIRSWARNIPDQVKDDLIKAFIQRNRSAVPIAPLISGARGARLRQPTPDHELPPALPEGAKAIGSLTLPGVSADGTRALILIRHSWSIHDAVVTYVLSKQGGIWKIAAKDQIVFI